MTASRPGVLAVRAVNDYRRRDVFGFLGVRYYLDNVAARTDDWARRVSTSLVMTRSQPAYFNAEHFKERVQGGAIEHRAMFIPGPNECLAEAALLAECAKYPRVFGNPECVCSYTLSEPESRVGTFRPYTFGLRLRQAAIARACEAVPSGFVRYTDVKKFYPSIDTKLARTAWERHCRVSGLADVYRNLGNELIEGYAGAGLKGGPAILTGPMLSHLLANLVLRDLDCDFSTKLPAAYCRYVDDIALIGEKWDVDRSLQIVKRKIEAIGLTLHEDDSPKSLVVPCRAWLPSRSDFSERKDNTSWIRLIGNLKRFLLQHPKEKDALNEALLQEGFRIPVRDYTAIVREQDFVRQVLRLAPWNWFRRRAQELAVPGIVDLARRLRDRLVGDFDQLFNGVAALTGYERKRRLSNLRYCIARLVYLASDDSLETLGNAIAEIPELYFHSQVMQAIATRKIDRVLAMGTNAAQATAQPLKVRGNAVTSTSNVFQTAKEQSLAVFLMNGVRVERPPRTNPDSELIRFADQGTDRAMMKSASAFMREIACLHGLSAKPRHSEVFDFAFDVDEALSMDAVTQLQQSVT